MTLNKTATVKVVEQLPLELHRNFALLRELDEQTQRKLIRGDTCDRCKLLTQS